MYLSLIAISFLASLGLILFFRRMDRPEVQTAKLLRLSNTRGDELEKLTQNYIQKIQDATLDFELTSKQSHKLQIELQNQLKHYENQLEEVKQKQAIVEDITSKFNDLAERSIHVSSQIDQLDRGLERLAYADEEIAAIKSSIKIMDAQLTRNQDESREKLSEVVQKLIQETEDRNRQLAENTRNSFLSLQNDSRQLEEQLSDHMALNEKITERVSNLSQSMDTRWDDEVKKLEIRFSQQENKLKERTDAMEKGLAGIRNTAVKALEDDLAHMRKEMENITLDVMARRDETLHETRNMSKQLQDQMKTFEESYMGSESKLLQDARSLGMELEERLVVIQNRFSEQNSQEAQRVREQLDELHLELATIRDEKLTKLQDTIESELNNAKKSLVAKSKEEEERLRFIQDEVSQLQENVGYLSREIKAEFRTESEMALSEFKNIQETAIADIVKLKAETRSSIEEFNNHYKQTHNQIDTQFKKNLDQLEKTQADIQEQLESNTSETQNSLVFLQDKMIAELQNTHDILVSNFDNKAVFVERKIDSMMQGITEQIENFQLDYNTARDMIENVQNTSAELTASFRSELKSMGRQFHGELNLLLDRYHNEMENQKLDMEQIVQNKIADMDQSADKMLLKISDNYEHKTAQFDNHIEKESNIKLIEFENKALEIEHHNENSIKLLQSQIDQLLSDAEVQKDDLLAKIRSESEILEEFRDKITLVDKSSEYIQKLEETLEVIEDRLSLAQEEKEGLNEFTEDLLDLRQTRKELESEVRLIETQRSRLSEAEKHFQRIEERLGEVDEKFAHIGMAEELAQAIEKRVEQFQEFKVSFEKFYGEINDKKNFIEQAVNFIEKTKSDLQKDQIDHKQTHEGFEKLKLRQENLTDILKGLESRTSALRSFEGDIQRVESRFEQIEDLIVDLSNKQKQVGAMSRKIEQMQDGGKILKEELDSLVHEADEKMDRLSAFYQMVDRLLDDNGNEESPLAMMKSRQTPGKQGGKIPEHKINGILSLHMNHKWEPDLIAERMNVDPAVVRAVISSHNK